MFTNKYLKRGYISVISIVFGLTMSTSLVMADSSLQSNSDYTLLKINEELNKTHHADLWSLRNNVFLNAHVRRDVWDTFLEKQNKNDTNQK